MLQAQRLHGTTSATLWVTRCSSTTPSSVKCTLLLLKLNHNVHCLNELAAYSKALQLRPDFVAAQYSRLHYLLHLCDWHGMAHLQPHWNTTLQVIVLFVSCEADVRI
jgi:hypothetical protein